jgi:hypothetical protein
MQCFATHDATDLLGPIIAREIAPEGPEPRAVTPGQQESPSIRPPSPKISRHHAMGLPGLALPGPVSTVARRSTIDG